MVRAIALGLLVALLAALSACGDGSSGTTASARSASATEPQTSSSETELCHNHQPSQASGLKVALSTGALPASLVVQEIERQHGDPGPWKQVSPDHLVERCVYTPSGALAMPSDGGCSVDVYLDADGRVTVNAGVASGGAVCTGAN
jgi:hypothetical protein